jgi:hypothetical protein
MLTVSIHSYLIKYINIEIITQTQKGREKQQTFFLHTNSLFICPVLFSYPSGHMGKHLSSCLNNIKSIEQYIYLTHELKQANNRSLDS